MVKDTTRQIRRECAMLWAGVYTALYKNGVKDPKILIKPYPDMVSSKLDALRKRDELDYANSVAHAVGCA